MKEIDNWKMLRKGNRVRKYNDRYDSSKGYRDGTVVKGIHSLSDDFVYVQWDGESTLDMSVNGYDLLKLQ